MYSISVSDSVNKKIYLTIFWCWTPTLVMSRTQVTGWRLSCSKTWRTVSGVVEDHLMCVCKDVVMSWNSSNPDDDTIEPVNLSMPWSQVGMI